MTITYTSLDRISLLLSDNWSIQPQPEVSAVWEKRVIAFVDDRRDQILITPRQESITYYGLYGNDHLHEILLDLDIRTYEDVSRQSAVVTEVLRIIKDNIRGNSNYMDLRVLNSYSRSEGIRNMFNHIITISYRVINP